MIYLFNIFLNCFIFFFNQIKGFPLYIHSKLSLRDYQVDNLSTILRITRAGEIIYGRLPGDDSWTVFISNHSTYRPVTYGRLSTSVNTEQLLDKNLLTDEVLDATYVAVMEDDGFYDGIRRIFFGNSFELWLHRLLFLDSLSFLSRGHLSQSLDRYLLIDIDDVFVGQPGSRMTEDDVTANNSFWPTARRNLSVG